MEQFKWADPQSRTAFPIARAGYPFIFAFAFITAVLALTGLTVLTIVFLIMTAFTCWFFRDPDRIIPNGNGLVVSPADGKVIITESVSNSPLGDDPCLKHLHVRTECSRQPHTLRRHGDGHQLLSG